MVLKERLGGWVIFLLTFFFEKIFFEKKIFFFWGIEPGCQKENASVSQLGYLSQINI